MYKDVFGSLIYNTQKLVIESMVVYSYRGVLYNNKGAVGNFPGVGDVLHFDLRSSYLEIFIL